MNTLKTIAASAGLYCAGAVLGLSSALAAIPIQHWTQPSGAQVYLVESPSIPMLDVQLDFDAGTRRDPAKQPGLADVTALMAGMGVAAKGGQPALDENQLGQAWADLGASFGASAGADRMSFRLRTLTEPDLLAKSVALASRQLGDPSFPEAVWRRERERLSAALREADTRPGTIAGRAFSQAVYGNHPYGYDTTPASLQRIGVADMRARYRDFILPCRAKVSLVGAVTRAQADQLVTQLLARLPQGARCAALPPVPEVAPLTAAKEERVPFQAAQAQVLIGQPGYKRDDPDFFPAFVLNEVIGGGRFTARLMTEVREKRGLTYGIGTYLVNMEHADMVLGQFSASNDKVAEAIKVVQEEWGRLVSEGVTPEELETTKTYLTGSYPLRFDGNGPIASILVGMQMDGMPIDYVTTRNAKIEAVTAEDIKRVAARLFKPEALQFVVVGQPEGM